jgi:hypothetical protein
MERLTLCRPLICKRKRTHLLPPQRLLQRSSITTIISNSKQLRAGMWPYEWHQVKVNISLVIQRMHLPTVAVLTGRPVIQGSWSGFPIQVAVSYRRRAIF